MDTPSTGDYIEIKKRKAIAVEDMSQSSSDHTTWKQYATLKNTNTYTNDLQREPVQRFQIRLPTEK
tara:strand:+ start:417 stop:614 length:198 start_codon:yes stop_codon:yes gene_type:complete